MFKKYFIVLGGGKDQLNLIKNIKELNYKLIVFDKNKNCPGFDFADLSFNIDFSNYKKVIKKLSELKKKFNLNYHGVITMGSDVPLIIHKIAKKFKLYCNTFKMAEVSQNKILMKKLFKKIKISSPSYKVVKDKKGIIDFWRNQNCKYLIIKPSDASGSKGVRAITSEGQIFSAINNVKKNTKKNIFMIEELVEGPQLSTESIIVNKKIFTPAISYRNYSDVHNFLPQILENGGIISSEYLKYKSQIEFIKKKIAKNMKFFNGIIKGDFVIKNKKLMLIEFTTRLSGGDLSETLGPLSNGINYVKQTIKIAAREKINLKDLKPKYFKIISNKYFFLPMGILQKISGIKKLKKIKGIHKIDFYYELNSKIPKIDSHGKRVGVFIVSGNKESVVNELIDKVYNTVKFKVSNKWYSGHPKTLGQKQLNFKTINLM